MTTDARALIAAAGERVGRTGVLRETPYLAELLTGYSAALDEVERLRMLTVAADAAVSAYGEIERRSGEEVLKLRVELGELKLLLEQQDRDLARLRHLRQLAAERYEEAEEVHALAGDAVQGPRPTIAGLREGLREALSWIADRSPDGSTLVDRLKTLLPSEET
jgi:hypothetical protein